MLSGSFPIFALSNHTTFNQTQTGVTVPLKAWDRQICSVLLVLAILADFPAGTVHSHSVRTGPV
jgi:hypothetical protein